MCQPLPLVCLATEGCWWGLPGKGDRVRLTGVTDQTSWFNKGGQRAGHPNSSHPTTREHLHPMVEPPSLISMHFPCPFVAKPTDLSGCSGLQVWLCSQAHQFPAVRSWSAPLGMSTGRAKAAQGWRLTLALCGHCFPTNLLLSGWEQSCCCPAHCGKGLDSFSHPQTGGCYPRQLSFCNVL